MPPYGDKNAKGCFTKPYAFANTLFDLNNHFNFNCPVMRDGHAHGTAGVTACLTKNFEQETPRGEVEALLEEPQELTVDPALMAVLAERHWDDFGRRATEAWVYYGWAIFFDDKEVVGMVRRVSRSRASV